MKIIVLSKALKDKHIEKINKTAAGIEAEVVFVKDESEIPVAFADAEILYGFGMNTAQTAEVLKRLSYYSTRNRRYRKLFCKESESV